MNTAKYQSNGQPIFLDFTDLKEKLGYTTRKPKVGSLGRALIKASKESNQGSIKWLKNHLDTFFKKNRQQKIKKKGRKGER